MRQKERYLSILSGQPELISFSRAARECLREMPAGLGDEAEVLYQTSACVTAPVLTAYVYWVLVNAVRRGIQVLYFLARDGKVMYETARILNRSLRLDIELRYLYVSRLALRKAQYCMDAEETLAYICGDGLRISLNVAMKRSGLADEVCRGILDSLGYPRDCRDVLLSGTALEDLKRKLRQSEGFHAVMKENSLRERSLIRRYLSQEGMQSGRPFALVDSGWTGSIQHSLSQILRESCEPPVKLSGFYFGIQSKPRQEAGEYICFYFSWERKYRKRFIRFNNNLFECWCMADHGMTVGYREENGRVEPSLKLYAPLWHEKEQAEFIRQYACRLGSLVEAGDRPEAEALSRCLVPLVRRAMQRPDRREVSVYGKIPFCDDATEAYLAPLAAPLSAWDLFCNLTLVRIFTKCFLRPGKRFFLESCWKEGTYTALPQPLSALFLLDCRFSYFIKSLRP